MAKKEQKTICDFCGGIGQLSFFKGASRFLLSTEECEECAGTGYRLESESKGGDGVGEEKKKRSKKTG
jgi:DnaJ-class molecular chaperone